MKVERGGKEYEVLDETETDVLVEDEFLYADEPHKRMLQMWWDKKSVRIVCND